MEDNGLIRKSKTGATRDTSNGKNDYEGFNNPLVELEFGNYMTEHRIQSDGSLRDSDNWQNGFGETTKETKDIMIKSLHRHYIDLWAIHRGYFVYKDRSYGGEKTHFLIEELDLLPDNWKAVTVADCLGGIRFNSNGYWLEEIKQRKNNILKK